MDFHQIYALILWRSALGLLMGKFCQFLTALSACDMIMSEYYCFIFFLPDIIHHSQIVCMLRLNMDLHC